MVKLHVTLTPTDSFSGRVSPWAHSESPFWDEALGYLIPKFLLIFPSAGPWSFVRWSACLGDTVCIAAEAVGFDEGRLDPMC